MWLARRADYIVAALTVIVLCMIVIGPAGWVADVVVIGGMIACVMLICNKILCAELVPEV